MKKPIIAFALACAVSFGAGAQVLESAHPEVDSVAFARVRARMDSIRQYRPRWTCAIASPARITSRSGAVR